MNDSYSNYILERLRKGRNYSSQYRSAITAIDFYSAEKEFYLLQFYFSECLLLKCSANGGEQKRVGVLSWRKFQHGLDGVIKNTPDELIAKYDKAFYVKEGVCLYDPFYDVLSPQLCQYKEAICDALKDIELDENMHVYVCGQECFLTKSVMFALQRKTANVVMMQKHDDLNLSEAKRVLHLQSFEAMHLNTSVTMSVADCFAPQTFYVPLADMTLDSELCNGNTWRDLLVDTETEDCCIINGVTCKCVTVKTRVDIFNNVFCSVLRDGVPQKTILLHNALGVNLSDKKTEQPAPRPAEPAPKPVTTPKPATPAPENKEEPNADTSARLPIVSAPVEGYEGIKLATDGVVPYDIEDLFGYYLLDNGGVREICFRDAYLYQNADLLEAFIHEILTKLGDKLTRFRTFRIVTLPDEKIEATYNAKLSRFDNSKELSSEDSKERKIAQYQLKRVKDFKKKIVDIEKVLRQREITFVRDYLQEEDPDGNHKRTMAFDNGWCIDMEGGLNKLFHSKNDMDNAKCGKTTLYYYHKGERGEKNESQYNPPRNGQPCVVKVITKNEKNLTPEKLFKHYLLDSHGTARIALRDRYLLSNPEMLKTFILKLCGISRVANRDNSEIKVVSHFSLYIRKITEGNKAFFNGKFANMKKDNVTFELKELSQDDKEGDHKRCLVFEDNGWCIDLEGGLDKLYESETDMRDGKCQNTTLYYCKEQ